MRKVLIIISVVALTWLLVAPTLHAFGLASAATSRYGMWIGTIGWFTTAPWWIRYEKG